MNSTLRTMVVGASLVAAMAAAPAAAFADPGTTPPSVSTACGTPLTPSEIQSVISLSDTSAISGADDLARFDDEVERNRQITAILVSHHDWRGLFAVGLDAAERTGMVPLQHGAASFANPAFGHAFTPELLRRFLANVHEEFLGRPTDPQWTHYFDLARSCDGSPTGVALAGYNAHLGVDVANSLAAVHAGLLDAADYVKIVSVVVQQGGLIVDRTREAYGVDMGPVWNTMIAASPVICGVAFVNGLGLQDPLLVGLTEAEIETLWRLTNAVIGVLAG